MQIACHACDLLQLLPPLPPGGISKCLRCHSVLYRQKLDSLNRALAFSLAGLILLAVAHFFPFLAFRMQGQVTKALLITGVLNLYAQGMLVVATLVLMTTIVVPAVQLMLLLYVLVPLKFGHVPWRLPQMFRLLLNLTPWSMMEIFMLGILVSIVKLVGMATIVPGLALWSFALLVVVLAGTNLRRDTL